MNSIKGNQRPFRRRLATALFLILAILAEFAASLTDTNNNTQTEARNGPGGPFHMSWTSKNTRYDFVFNINDTPIQSLVKLESDPENYLTNSLVDCINQKQQQHSVACLFTNGTYLKSFLIDANRTHESVFYSTNNNLTHTTSTKEASPNTCDTGSKLKISHYCSTHWNPPLYLTHYDCLHLFEWHSPLTCHSNATNQEHPCYIYEPTGKLVDLTPWILSNGSSYQVDVSGTKVKKFNLNVCNEAHEPCGPNVSACIVDEHANIVETGLNNLTSMRYDAKERAVLLTSLGSFKEQCEGSRIRTVIRFICKNKIIPVTGPKLIRSSSCEHIVEWPSIHACPISEVRVPATECTIKYEPLGIYIDILNLANQQSLVEINSIKIDGQEKKMLLGVCQGIPKSVKCEGKQNSNTMACLMDANNNSTIKSANNSMVVGSVSKSFIRLSDERVYLESHAVNRSCSEPAHGHFNVTQQLGTRIEFFCSPTAMKQPTFLAYDDCTYIFEWGSPLLCLEAFGKVVMEQTTSRPSIAISYEKLKEVTKNDNRKVKTFTQSSANEEKPKQPSVHMDANAGVKPTKMNGGHNFFMISLIVISFTAFIIVIFVLDKKTRLRITLRQARQALQPNQQPYSRVVDDLDL